MNWLKKRSVEYDVDDTESMLTAIGLIADSLVSKYHEEKFGTKDVKVQNELAQKEFLMKKV